MSRAVVIGLARTGAAVARALYADGYQVVVVDRADDGRVRRQAAELPRAIDVRLGGYPEDIAAGADLVSPSPGVRWDAPALEYARARGVAVRSEMDLVFERCRSRIVGVTGTNGKTTTTALIAAILERGPDRVLLGGNIGAPVIDRLSSVGDEDWVVLELSSFQLETVAEPRCAIACVLNVTPDHLDRHGSFEAYADVKARIVRHARQTAVLGYDDPVTRDMARLSPVRVRFFGHDIGSGDGAAVHEGTVVSIEAGAMTPVMPVEAVPLFGAHNVLNVLAAVAASRAASMQAGEIADAVRAFHAVPHRLEVVADSGGVLWVNDSKATNAESAIVALRAFGERPLVWIAGGIGASAVSPALLDEVEAHVRVAVLNGESAPQIDAALAQRGFTARRITHTLDESVRAARGIAVPGDVVLLSPAYKSFDQFRDFEHRGDAFRELVHTLVDAEARTV